MVRLYLIVIYNLIYMVRTKREPLVYRSRPLHLYYVDLKPFPKHTRPTQLWYACCITCTSYSVAPALIRKLLIPLSPTPHPSINRVSTHTIPYKPHNHTQRLHVLVPALVVEEQHVLVFYPAVPVYPLKVRRLAARVDLKVIEAVYSSLGRRRGRGMRDLEELEHVAAEIRGVGA